MPEKTIQMIVADDGCSLLIKRDTDSEIQSLMGCAKYCLHLENWVRLRDLCDEAILILKSRRGSI